MILRRTLAVLALALGLTFLGAAAVSAAPARPTQDSTTTVLGEPVTAGDPEPEATEATGSGPVLVVGVIAMTVAAVGFGIWLRRREG